MSFILIVIASVTFLLESSCVYYYFDVIWLFTLLPTKKKIQCDISVYGCLFSFSFNTHQFFIGIFVLKWNSKFLGE